MSKSMNTTKLRIHTWPEDILRKKCKEVVAVDSKIKAYLDQMLVLMRLSNGAGLAGNQAGLDLSLIVIEVENHTFKLINPRIVKKEGLIKFREGCLSFPGLELDIKRADRIWVSAQDEQGKPVKIEAKGFLSVIFQHEIDHIGGIAFIDRISFWQKLKAYTILRKIMRRTKYGVSKQNSK